MKKILFIGLLLLVVFLFFAEKGGGPIVSGNGISINQLADDLMSKYDRNLNGKIDVAEESFLRTEMDNVKKVESRGLLFTDADVFGNKDGYVLKDELMDYLEEFDTDGNGELTSFKNIFDSIFNGKSEWGKFDDKYGERFKYSNR